MTDATENLVLEQLRHIRATVDATRTEVRDLRDAQSSMAIQLAALRRDQATAMADIATLAVRIDRLSDRLERVEIRLGLVDA